MAEGRVHTITLADEAATVRLAGRVAKGAFVVLLAVGFMLRAWWREYGLGTGRPAQHAQQVWFWLALGVAGQALFAARFVLQWIATERKGRSVIPKAFWHLSLVAAVLQASCFIQRAEWVFAAGMAATILIYARNIWFVYHGEDAEPPA